MTTSGRAQRRDKPSPADRVAAETWFLSRGLPAVLRPGALVRRLWQRSAPALAGFAVFMANSMLVVTVTGQHTINIDGRTVTRDQMDEYLDFGKPILAYTINDPRRALELFEWGVTSVFSDNPDEIRDEVESVH